MSESKGFVGVLENIIFKGRIAILIVLGLFTALMVFQAVTKMRVDAGFEKQVPLGHPYMQTYLKYKDTFAGTNRILIALIQDEGEMFNEKFLDALKKATDEVFFIKGVDRSRVSSLFTPDVRYIEVVEGGFAGGNVIPADYAPSPEMFDRVKNNTIKSGVIGRLVTEDLRGAMITAELVSKEPWTDEQRDEMRAEKERVEAEGGVYIEPEQPNLDYVRVSNELEEKIRGQFEKDGIKVHMIGFAKVVGDIVNAIKVVVLFFGMTLILAGVLLYFYSGSLKLTVLPLLTAMTAVIWQFGLLATFGFGIDPMSILVPFLVFAIGVSHGVQMINSWMEQIVQPGADGKSAARVTFSRLLVPASVALISDTVGFATIYVIEIRTIQEMAITASMGVGVILITNLLLMPIFLSFVKIRNMEKYHKKVEARLHFGDGLWRLMSNLTQRIPALVVVAICIGLFFFGNHESKNLKIGDLQAGVPELRPDSRYNQDTAAVVENFSIGVDIVQVIAEVPPEGCIKYEYMENIDRFNWYMENQPGVQGVISLAKVAKIVNTGWNEGNMQWRMLPRNQFIMVQSVSPIETATGLLNSDCSAMPLLIFTEDHKAETLAHVIQATKDFNKENGTDSVQFTLVTGNAGVMAATNEVVEEAQTDIVIYVYAAIIALCLIMFAVQFRSLIIAVTATICVVLPLALVSVLGYAVMTWLDIGLKVPTLPVVALGVGIGIDYGIYIFGVMGDLLMDGVPLKEAYYRTLKMTGKAVLFTAFTLGLGVSTWVLSDLQFQIDMGKLLAYMFFVNMLAAMLVVPALSHFLVQPFLKNKVKAKEEPAPAAQATSTSGPF